MANENHLAALEDKLDTIEAELKRIGFWHDPPLPGGETPFSEPGFEAWLQNTFLPRARTSVAENALPKKSQVGVLAMRQYDYHSVLEKALPLVRMLHEFDELVVRAANE